jgi:hypothetical protein
MGEKFERNNGELFTQFGDFLGGAGPGPLSPDRRNHSGGSPSSFMSGMTGSTARVGPLSVTGNSVLSNPNGGVRNSKDVPEDANGYLIPNPGVRSSGYVAMGRVGDPVRFSRDADR